MPGSYYIWIMLAFFLATMLLLGLFTGLLYLGHVIERREIRAAGGPGAEAALKHGFLELPEAYRSRTLRPLAEELDEADATAEPPEPASQPSDKNNGGEVAG